MPISRLLVAGRHVVVCLVIVIVVVIGVEFEIDAV
jgi:hypothetical protein